MTLLLLVSIWFENPRIITDTDTVHNRVTKVDSSILLLTGEKNFYAQGEGKTGDIFQSTNLVIKGKTASGWQIQGLLFDSKLSPNEDMYTMNLKDVSTAFLLIKRRTDSFLLGRFALYNSSLDGGFVGFGYKHLKFRAGVGKKRGNEGVFDTIIKPPYDVPIKITLHNTSNFTMIENSERVLIDGKELGKAHYNIDYQRGILYLNLHDTSPMHHIMITFGYHTVSETPYVYDLNTSYESNMLMAQAEIYREKMAQASYPDSMGGVYLPDGKGDYEKEDSIFVYAGEGKGHYRVFFTLDTINGSYDYMASGNYYIYVGRGKGNYSPVHESLKPLLNYQSFRVKAGKRLYGVLEYTRSDLTQITPLASGNAIGVQAGVLTKNINLEIGMRNVKGSINTPLPYYDESKNSYDSHLFTEKYGEFELAKNSFHMRGSITYDSIPCWYTAASFKGAGIKIRGTEKAEETTLSYTKYPFSLSVYLKRPDEKIGIASINARGFPAANVFIAKDSTGKNYGISLNYAINTKNSNTETRVFKDKNFLTYLFSSHLSIQRTDINLSFGRLLDIQSSYIERFIKTESGSYIFDSTLNNMVPSEFGDYIRLIVPGEVQNTTYRNLLEVNINHTGKNYSYGLYLKSSRSLNTSLLNTTLSTHLPLFNGTELRTEYFQNRLLTTNNQNVYSESIRASMTLLSKKNFNPIFTYTENRDGLSETDKFNYGMGLRIKEKRIKNTLKITRGHFFPYENIYMGFEESLILSLPYTTLGLNGAYTNSDSIPYSTFLEIKAIKEFSISGVKNRMNFYAVFPRDLPVKWGLSTSLLF